MSSSSITLSARIVDSAEPPSAPIRPRVRLNITLGFVSGLVLAFGLAFIIDHLEATFKDLGEVEDYLQVPLLGIVPAVARRRVVALSREVRNGNKAAGPLRETPFEQDRGQRHDDIRFRFDKNGVGCVEMGEAIRNLRTSILFALGNDRSQSILVTSTVPGEGKTTISTNLSIALAQLGKRVLLIDADLRRPRVHTYFSIPNQIGLGTCLLEGMHRRTTVCPSDVPKLDVMASGGTPENPVELLSSDRMRELILESRSEYDFVIVDSPILINMADSRVLSSYVDATVLIVKHSATPRKLVRGVCNDLRAVSAKVIGVVVNHYKANDEQYAYSYCYSYSRSSSENKGRGMS